MSAVFGASPADKMAAKRDADVQAIVKINIRILFFFGEGSGRVFSILNFNEKNIPAETFFRVMGYYACSQCLAGAWNHGGSPFVFFFLSEGL